MGIDFSGSEVVEMGIQIEKNGRDFYTALAEKIKDAKTKEIFAYLAKQEENHIVDFQKILSSVHTYEPKESYPDEYFAYMHAIASGYVFTQKDKGKEIANGIGNEEQTLDMAIGFEKDSILLFDGMKRMLPESEHKILDELIKQEQSHLWQLWDLKEKGRHT